MRDQIIIPDKIGKVPHNLFTGSSIFKHVVGDTRIVFNKRIDTLPRIHQLLKSIGDFTIFNLNRTNFYGSVPIVWRETSGFKIENDKVIGSLLRNGFTYSVCLGWDRRFLR